MLTFAPRVEGTGSNRRGAPRPTRICPHVRRHRSLVTRRPRRRRSNDLTRELEDPGNNGECGIGKRLCDRAHPIVDERELETGWSEDAMAAKHLTYLIAAEKLGPHRGLTCVFGLGAIDHLLDEL